MAFKIYRRGEFKNKISDNARRLCDVKTTNPFIVVGGFYFV